MPWEKSELTGHFKRIPSDKIFFLLSLPCLAALVVSHSPAVYISEGVITYAQLPAVCVCGGGDYHEGAVFWGLPD